MLSIPIIQVRQVNARIGIETTPGVSEIKQPQPLIEIQTNPGQLDIASSKGTLEIDQSRAREDMGIGNTYTMMKRVSEEAMRISIEGIGRRVDEGNQLAAISKGGNPIADIAAKTFFIDYKINYTNDYTPGDVDVNNTKLPPDIRISTSTVDLQADTHEAEIHISPTQVSVYLAQKPEFELIPSQIDLKV